MAREVVQVFAPLGRPFELVLVDDCSTDETWQRIEELARKDARVRGVRHTRNAGQSAAVWTGFQNTQSGILATLDGDLQNDPADLPTLLARLAEADFACGVRLNRKDTILRRLSSQVARAARKMSFGVDFQDTGCAVRVFKRECLAGLFPFNGLHRFLPVLVHAAGHKVVEVPVNHRSRVAGVSKYGVWNRLGRGIVDLFGVAWYRKRLLKSVAVEHTGGSAV